MASVYGFRRRITKNGYPRLSCINCGENYGVFWNYEYKLKNGDVRIIGRCKNCARYVSVTMHDEDKEDE